MGISGYPLIAYPAKSASQAIWYVLHVAGRGSRASKDRGTTGCKAAKTARLERHKTKFFHQEADSEVPAPGV